MEIRKVGIVDFARSPIARSKNGSLNDVTPLELATQVVKQLLERNSRIPRDKVEHLVCGTAFPEAEGGLNLGRQITIRSGLPMEVAASTVNQFCGSSQQAVMMLADAIAVGKGDIGIAVGVEHMTRIPMGGFNPFYDKELYELGFYMGMGDTAELLAEEGPVSREAQEQFAMDSHRKALKAWADGAFVTEVVPIKLADGRLFDKDESMQEPNPDKIKTLAPAFDAKGTITAATASPVTVGAGAAIVMSEELAKKLGIKLRARIVTSAVAGCDYKRMGMGPLPATEKALARAGLAMSDIDVFEINEAFAAQSLYVIEKGKFPKDKVNILGGAIAIGHPLGMSGVRIIGTAITALEKVKGRFGLATMCVGGGQGVTTILERVEE
ncbi:MAG: thiolase family protein [Candidatus Riflebacteria bacterium]|nr:thiolase family protein [Candidatus Riflebacteria bacterium]